MPLAIPFLTALPTLLPAAMFLLPLFWRRHTQMFTIAVPPEFLHGAAATRIRLIYMVAICALGIGGFACTFLAAAHSLAAPLQGLFVAAPLVETAGLLVTWGWAWHKTLPHCLPHAVVRTASLTETETGAGWWASTLSAWMPLAPVGGGGGVQHAPALDTSIWEIPGARNSNRQKDPSRSASESDCSVCDGLAPDSPASTLD